MLSDLYNSDILTLAGQLRAERLTDPHGTARVVSKLCGSELEIDVEMDGDHVKDAAVRVRACALGQASAAILMDGIVGATLEDLNAARDALWAMLKAGEPAPEGRFAGLSTLDCVSNYPARHQSVMLAWNGAVEALKSAKSTA